MTVVRTWSGGSRSLLTRLLDAPGEMEAIRELPAAAFSTLVREVGLEDAGELLAMATTEQLVTAFDDDLFRNERPGEREEFSPRRFAVWLEVLLEGGEERAAAKFVELSEDFVVNAFSRLVLVLAEDGLRERMSEDEEGGEAVDKALESSLSEEIDGYLLVSREQEGWDALLELILALDRDHRSFLRRILDRCAGLASSLLDDLEELASHLTELESLAEDVEEEREVRRNAEGYVEPRAARSFLALLATPLSGQAESAERDPITKAYFRGLGRSVLPQEKGRGGERRERKGEESPGKLAPSSLETGADAFALLSLLRVWRTEEPELCAERLEELAYLANVLVAGAELGGERFRPAEALEAVLATVSFGAFVAGGSSSAAALARGFRASSADLLFRRASRELPDGGYLKSRGELDEALARFEKVKELSSSRSKKVRVPG